MSDDATAAFIRGSVVGAIAGTLHRRRWDDDVGSVADAILDDLTDAGWVVSRADSAPPVNGG